MENFDESETSAKFAKTRAEDGADVVPSSQFEVPDYRTYFGISDDGELLEGDADLEESNVCKQFEMKCNFDDGDVVKEKESPQRPVAAYESLAFAPQPISADFSSFLRKVVADAKVNSSSRGGDLPKLHDSNLGTGPLRLLKKRKKNKLSKRGSAEGVAQQDLVGNCRRDYHFRFQLTYGTRPTATALKDAKNNKDTEDADWW